ncbi:MAG: transposase, partial [Planctomycetota bacterium]
MNRTKRPYTNGPLELAVFGTMLPRDSAEFHRAFDTEEACRRWWIQKRWPNGFECPRCRGGGRWDARRRGFECRRCRKFTSLTAGTRLHGTRKPLLKWFEAIFLIVQRGVNARRLQRELGFTYKVAWTWGHKLRSLLEALAVPGEL